MYSERRECDLEDPKLNLPDLSTHHKSEMARPEILTTSHFAGEKLYPFFQPLPKYDSHRVYLGRKLLT
jgi:hypothetical protein